MKEILTEKMKKWVIDKHNEGYTQAEIAEALYVSIYTIKKVLHNAEHKPRALPTYDGSDEIEWIRRLYFEGYQYKEIAETLNTYGMKITRIVDKYKMERDPELSKKLVYDFSQE